MAKRPKNDPTPDPTPEPEPTPTPDPANPPGPPSIDEVLAELLKVKAERDQYRDMVFEKQRAIKSLDSRIKTMSENDRRLADHLAMIRELETDVAEKVKGAAAAKKELEHEYEKHRAMEEELRRGQLRLPFDSVADPEPIPADDPTIDPPAVTVENAGPAPPAPTPDIDPTAATVSVEALIRHGLPRKRAESLQKAGLTHVGDIGRWTSPIPDGKGRTLADIKGIKGKGEDELIGALAAFWAEWKPTPAETPPAEPASEPAATSPEPAPGDTGTLFPTEDDGSTDIPWQEILTDELNIPTKIKQIIGDFTFDPSLATVGGLVYFMEAGNDLDLIPGMTVSRKAIVEGALDALFESLRAEGKGFPAGWFPEDGDAEPESTDEDAA